ncbi:MAG: molybdopterin-dependent oxidoreductase [Longimicrobiales bacterium]|nr:molybdopterin-dependent oxidoreductase [Longimicrobiales bacterium]
MPLHTTACPRNCYSTCTMTVEVEDGRLRRILPHAGNHATLEGPCLKGLAYVERVASPHRILHPLRRQRDGSFKAVSWDEALGEIAGRLARIRDEHGPQAVLYYSASGTKGLLNRVGGAFWRLYGGYTGTYGDLCWPAGLEATRLTLGENKHNAPWDLANARLIVLWGKNAAETNIHQMPFVEAALEAGGRLIVVDPRRTETAERAELLIQPRPGTDGALALAVAHVLFRDGLVNRSFLDAHVAGHDEYRDRVGTLTPAWAERITGVPERYVERLAEAMGSVKPMTVAAGFGMQRYTNSGQTMRAMIALAALTGNVGKPGAGWQCANLQTAVFDDVKDPVAFYPPETPDGVARIAVSTARLGADMMALRDPPLKMAWVERGNPIPQNPDTAKVLEAFRSLDFRVVVEQFLTDTAREADIVLPAKTMFEQTDVIGAYWHPYVQLRKKVLEPPGEVKPESEIYRLLAERLGFPIAAVDAVLPGLGDQAVEAWLERRLAPFPELSLERLAQGPVLAPGHEEVAFADLRFSTPSGKIELRSEDAATRWEVDPLPGWSEPAEAVSTTGSDGGRFPLFFMTPNTKNRIHSQFGNLDMIRAHDPGPVVRVSPADALPRGIRDGDRVRVFNDRGSLELPCTLDFGLRAGCVSLTNGWWITDGGAVNLLSAGRETDMGHGAAFHDNRVELERAGA